MNVEAEGSLEPVGGSDSFRCSAEASQRCSLSPGPRCLQLLEAVIVQNIFLRLNKALASFWHCSSRGKIAVLCSGEVWGICGWWHCCWWHGPERSAMCLRGPCH